MLIWHCARDLRPGTRNAQGPRYTLVDYTQRFRIGVTYCNLHTLPFVCLLCFPWTQSWALPLAGPGFAIDRSGKTPQSYWRCAYPKTVPYGRQSGLSFPALTSPTMKVVSTFHHPSAVSCSTKCKFSPDDREYLVVGKTNRLELYSLQHKGLNLESTLDVWGHVVTIRPVEFTVSPSPVERCARF